ncbi:MAG: T9SS type A sorting domain-containing protein [bacterium]
MRAKHLLIVAALIFTATMAMAQPNVPTINVDTLVNLGKFVQGESSGAFFLPDGNIIAVKGDTPYIIDSKSGEILRTLEKSPIESVLEPEITKDGTKLVASVMGPRFEVWDIPSGKIIKKSDPIIRYFCLSPDGTKLFATLYNDPAKPGLIAVFDMTTFQEIERLSYGGLQTAFSIDISPDGQTLAVSVDKTPDGSSDTQTNQVVLINLNDKKNYTVVEPDGDGFLTMQFSPDGKRIASLYNDGNHIYIYIYDLETKEEKYIKLEELSNMFEMQLMGIGTPSFINRNTILCTVGNSTTGKTYLFSWNIPENRIKNIINYDSKQSVDFKDSIILICNIRGVLAYINNNIVPIVDLSILNESILTYNNNRLEYYSNESFIGECFIYDTTGKMIVDLGPQQFITGKNTIPINKPLNTGIYILTIDTGSEPLSYKFLVE